MDKVIDKDPLAWLDDAPDKATKWKNLAFAKDGRSKLGPLVFNSEKEARDRIEKNNKEARETMERRGRPDIFMTRRGWWLSEDSHHMQIPVKE